MVNRNKPHLLVLSEDSATHDIAVGFNDYATGAIQVCKCLKGWPDVLKTFQKIYVDYLRQYTDAHIVLLIDFDNVFPVRLQLFQNAIPNDIADRVFVFGALDEAETLKKGANLSLSNIGLTLAKECEDGTTNLWNNVQVRHNTAERVRLHAKCRNFLMV